MLDENKYVIIRLDKEEYAISISNVNSIEKVSPITDSLQSEEFVLGYVYYRDNIRLVLDLKKYLKDVPTKITENSKFIFLNVQNTQIGFLIDEADEVMEIDESNIDAQLSFNPYMKAASIDNRIIVLIDILTMLHNKETFDTLQLEQTVKG